VSDDTFFALPQDSTWNACIGRQGDELHYLDGYIEAAWELADAVIQKNILARRDTSASRPQIPTSLSRYGISSTRRTCFSAFRLAPGRLGLAKQLEGL
jgi:hypothetical protein